MSWLVPNSLPRWMVLLFCYRQYQIFINFSTILLCFILTIWGYLQNIQLELRINGRKIFIRHRSGLFSLLSDLKNKKNIVLVFLDSFFCPATSSCICILNGSFFKRFSNKTTLKYIKMLDKKPNFQNECTVFFWYVDLLNYENKESIMNASHRNFFSFIRSLSQMFCKNPHVCFMSTFLVTFQNIFKLTLIDETRKNLFSPHMT